MMDLQDRYLQVQVQTATPATLVTMLYDGAIRFLRQAKANLSSHKLQEANYFLIRSENILSELNATLDMSRGEIPKNLSLLYDYMLRRLFEANAKKDVSVIDEVVGLLSGLRDTWVQAAKSVSGNAHAGAGILHQL